MYKKANLTVLIATVLLAFCSCVKNDPPVANPGTVNLNVINAITDTSIVINYYINGARQNSVTGIYPLANSGYSAVNRGETVIAFRRLFDNQNYNYADTLFTFPVKLDSAASNVSYSLFLSGLNRNSAFLIKDTLASDAKNALLRFVPATQEMPQVRVYLNDTLRFTSSSFKAVSAFIPVGNGKKTIRISPLNTNEVLYTSNITLNAGTIYTLFSQGRRNSFRAGLIVNQ